jgi:hypothetical protein
MEVHDPPPPAPEKSELPNQISKVVLKLLLPVVHVFRDGRGLKYQYSVIPKSGVK